MKKKQASATVYIFALMVIFLSLAAFAIDGSVVFTNRMKLQNITEMTAMLAAAEFNNPLATDDATKIAKVTTAAKDNFKILSSDGLSHATIKVTVNTSSNKILVETSAKSQPFFIALLGINAIELEAKACAQSQQKNVMAYYSGINWLTPKAAYLSDILSKDLNLNDTAILLPLGDYNSASYDSSIINFNLIDSGDSKPLSLGPGGFITIRLPAPIIDKIGKDLYVKEIGSLEGYMVFAGIDKNPENPYVQKDNEGGGISWINITCSGTPEASDSNGLLGKYSAATDNMGAQTKIYGSAYFDFSDSCTGGISMAKYIRIVDDNSESAFVTNGDGYYYKAMLYGEASSATSGADIDEVKVLNYVELKASSEFTE